MVDRLSANQVVRHYKGGLYTILFQAQNATNSADRDDMVVYVSHTTGVVYVRDYAEFWGDIEILNHITGKKDIVKRFAHESWVNE